MPTRELTTHVRCDGAEILTDDDRTGTLHFEGEHTEQRLGVVRHVGAVARGAVSRNPPHPEVTEDVVDPHTTGVTQQPAQHVAQRRISELGQPARMPRWHAPVLT